MDNITTNPNNVLEFLKGQLTATKDAIEIVETNEEYLTTIGDIKVPEYLYDMVRILENEILMMKEIVRLRELLNQR